MIRRTGGGAAGMKPVRHTLPARAAKVLVLAALFLAACRAGFQVRRYTTDDALFAASLAEFNKGKWDHAITGFEKLTLDLSARDTLLPLAHWYLGTAHERQGDHILAATSFVRLAESFPDDSLADDALLAAGRAYAGMWRNPELDPTYGAMAQTQFQLLSTVYPDSPLRSAADSAMKRLDENYAAKDYLNAMFYERRRCWDCAIIYFKDVVKNHPDSDHARLALLGMLRVYRKPQMNYKEEAAETCITLRSVYAGDKDVARVCPTPVAADSTVKAGTPAKPAAGDSATGPPRRPPAR